MIGLNNGTRPQQRLKISIPAGRRRDSSTAYATITISARGGHSDEFLAKIVVLVQIVPQQTATSLGHGSAGVIS